MAGAAARNAVVDVTRANVAMAAWQMMALNKVSHGGRSVPLDSSPLSPQRKTAPCARRARRKDDVVQAGLLARGSWSFSAFPGLAVQSPVATWRGTRRRQLRGQLRI